MSFIQCVLWYFYDPWSKQHSCVYHTLWHPAHQHIVERKHSAVMAQTKMTYSIQNNISYEADMNIIYRHNIRSPFGLQYIGLRPPYEIFRGPFCFYSIRCLCWYWRFQKSVGTLITAKDDMYIWKRQIFPRNVAKSQMSPFASHGWGI